MLNVVIFVESVVHRSNWRSRETETVGNSRERPGVIMPTLSKIVNPHFFCQKKTSAQSLFLISRGLRVLGFLGYIEFQSQNASFRATCAQKGREEKK